MNRHFVHLGLFCLWISSLDASAQLTNRSSVLDSAGTRSSGSGYTNHSAVGQPGGIAESTGGSLVNQAGFLQTYILKPGLDTDHDGQPDELDRDNDNDDLADPVEIAGTGFDPIAPTLLNLADTDGDGQLDGWEATAGTDPNNLDSVLKLVAISNAPAGRGVAWMARGNNQRIYVVRATSEARQPYSTVIFSNTVSGGSAPWFAVTNAVIDPGASNQQFYAVEVVP